MLVYSGTENQWKGEAINGVRHPQNIETLWTEAELAGIGLARFVQPASETVPVDPLSIPISRMQFKAILRINNLLDRVKLAIDAIEDPIHRAVAMSKFEENDFYNRDDPLFAQLGSVLGLTPVDIDQMWLQALEIE